MDAPYNKLNWISLVGVTPTVRSMTHARAHASAHSNRTAPLIRAGTSAKSHLKHMFIWHHADEACVRSRASTRRKSCHCSSIVSPFSVPSHSFTILGESGNACNSLAGLHPLRSFIEDMRPPTLRKCIFRQRYARKRPTNWSYALASYSVRQVFFHECIAAQHAQFGARNKPEMSRDWHYFYRVLLTANV